MNKTWHEEVLEVYNQSRLTLHLESKLHRQAIHRLHLLYLVSSTDLKVLYLFTYQTIRLPVHTSQTFTHTRLSRFSHIYTMVNSLQCLVDTIITSEQPEAKSAYAKCPTIGCGGEPVQRGEKCASCDWRRPDNDD
jgi:hypothetical protein